MALSRPPAAPEPESLDELRGDCARMAPHWYAPGPGALTGASASAPPAPAPPPEALHGVRVPARSARLVAGMPEYGTDCA